MAIRIGGLAPNFQVQRVDGLPVGLTDFDGHPLVLIFLRHLA